MNLRIFQVQREEKIKYFEKKSKQEMYRKEIDKANQQTKLEKQREQEQSNLFELRVYLPI